MFYKHHLCHSLLCVCLAVPRVGRRVGITQPLPVLAHLWVLPGAGGTGRSCWGGLAGGEAAPSITDLSAPSAALMGSAGSEQSKANEVGDKIKNRGKSQAGIGGDTQLPPAGLDHPPQGTTNSCCCFCWLLPASLPGW